MKLFENNCQMTINKYNNNYYQQTHINFNLKEQFTYSKSLSSKISISQRTTQKNQSEATLKLQKRLNKA